MTRLKLLGGVLAAFGLATALGVHADEPIEDAVAEMEPAVTTGVNDDGEREAVEVRTPYAAMDHLLLDESSIIGNRELPKVLYIVPWKKADLGDLMGRPVNSLLNEVLMPVDRDVFRRHLDYYEELNEPKDEITESD